MLTPLNQTLVCKAKIATAANDDVVQTPNAHNLAHFAQPARDLQILIARCRITAGVVVDEDQPGGHVGDGWPEYIARMH